MKKDFRKWHDKKSQIDTVLKRPFFHEKEIWFCHLGVNVGSEQDGRGGNFLRPVIVVRKFNNEVFWAIPLTKTEKKTEYYFQFSFHNNEISTAILSQIRLIDARRLSHLVDEISQKDFDTLIKKLKEYFP